MRFGEHNHAAQSGNLKKLKRFKSIKRGYYSLSSFGPGGHLPCWRNCWSTAGPGGELSGELYFPTYGDVIPGQHFGLDYEYETNYRQLKSQFAGRDKGIGCCCPGPLEPL